MQRNMQRRVGAGVHTVSGLLIGGRAIGPLVAALLLSGCAQYRYYIDQPERYAGIVPEREIRTIEYDPLRYRFSEQKDSLAISIENPTTQPVRIEDRGSYVVTPDGQTREPPVRFSIVASNSYTTMILPPQRQVAQPGSAWNFGVGFGLGAPLGYRGFYHDPFFYPGVGFYSPLYYSEPAYYVTDVPIWDWREGDVGLVLQYQSGTNTFSHQFQFSRRKVK